MQFDARYDGNILVNAFTCGVARADRIFYGRASGVGNSHPLHRRQDRARRHPRRDDGERRVHGRRARRKRPTMQVGDPFMGKLLIEACLELFAEDVLEGIQDMGAAGLTSSSVEMAGRAKNGDRARPRRRPAPREGDDAVRDPPERVAGAHAPRRQAGLRGRASSQICKKWDLDAAVIGKVTDTKRWVVKATPGYDPLADGPTTRAPGRRLRPPHRRRSPTTPPSTTARAPRAAQRRAPIDAAAIAAPVRRSLRASSLALVGSPNVGSRALGLAAVRPDRPRRHDRAPGLRRGASCACRASGTATTIEKLLAFAVDCNGRTCELDPFAGGAMAIAEVCRNLVCTGAEPIGDHRLPELRQPRAARGDGAVRARDRRRSPRRARRSACRS